MSRPDVITSPRNPRIAAAARLRRSRARRAEGRTLLEGPHVVAAALTAGAAVEVVFVGEGDPAPAGSDSVEVIAVSSTVLDRLAPTEHPRGPVAVMRIPDAVPPRRRDALVMWGVADPGNVGTLVRTAAAFGLDAVVGPDCADPWAPKVLRAAAGAHFGTTVATAGSVAELVATGLTTAATVVAGGNDPRTLPAGPVAVLVGSEARGLPADVVSGCDLRVTIPMPGGTESLNAAVAGAIVGYELSRLRARPG